MDNKNNIILSILKIFFCICFFPIVLIILCFKRNSNNECKTNDGITMNEIIDYEELMED